MAQKFNESLPLEGGGKERVIKKYALLHLCRHNRQNATDAERKIWSAIRSDKIGFSFRRQQQIGKYIVDFVCLSEKLIIECDGGQHTKTADYERTHFLEMEGYTILRFWNNEILHNIDGCVKRIQEVLDGHYHHHYKSSFDRKELKEI